MTNLEGGPKDGKFDERHGLSDAQFQYAYKIRKEIEYEGDQRSVAKGRWWRSEASRMDERETVRRSFALTVKAQWGKQRRHLNVPVLIKRRPPVHRPIRKTRVLTEGT